MTSQAIDLYSKLTSPIEAIDKMGEWIAKSGMFGCSKVEQGKVVALVCMTEQITPAQFNRTYDVLSDGKIRKKANAALAEFRQKGGKHRWIKDGNDGKEASIELTFEGQTITSRFTIEDAKRMGASFKDGSAWVKTPGNMLRVRAISNGIIMLAPEIYAGEEDSCDQPVPEINLSTAPAGTAGPEKVITPKEFQNPAATVTVEPPTEIVVEEKNLDADVQRDIERTQAHQEVKAAIAADKAKAGELPNELTMQVIEAIGDELAAPALEYLVKINWLKPGQAIGFLSEGNAKKIISGADRFKNAVKQFAAKA